MSPGRAKSYEAPSVLMTLALKAWGQRLSKRPGAKRPKCSRAATQIQASLMSQWHKREVLMRAYNVGSLRQSRPDVSEPRTRV